MSLGVTVLTGAGIVMATDTRATDTRDAPDKRRKIFMSPRNVGVSLTFNIRREKRAHIQIESLVAEATLASPGELAEYLHERISPVVVEAPDVVQCHVAGYEKGQAEVWGVSTREGVHRVMTGQVGAAWIGEPHALMRLIQPVYKINHDGEYEALPHFPIPWQDLTLEEAVDFAVFGIRATERMLKYQRMPTVGGEIHVRVITTVGTYALTIGEGEGSTA